jgi:two-component system, OmpR family, KDP operon response regulator KdpE
MLNPSPTKLLVIDQDTLGENFIKQTLNPNGYDVIKVNSSADGIQTSQSWNPDLIIINIMQPAVNGWKLCRKLRQFSQAPILVLAAVSDPNSIALWLDAGADDYLTKPFSSDILVAHLQKLTRRFTLKQNNPSLTIA